MQPNNDMAHILRYVSLLMHALRILIRLSKNQTDVLSTDPSSDSGRLAAKLYALFGVPEVKKLSEFVLAPSNSNLTWFEGSRVE